MFNTVIKQIIFMKYSILIKFNNEN